MRYFGVACAVVALMFWTGTEPASAQTGARSPDGSGKPSKPVAPPTQASTIERTIAIGVQPNTGEIDAHGQAAFSPNGRLLAFNDNQRIKLWDLGTGRPLRSLEHFAYFEQFTFDVDGRNIVSVHRDGMIRTWETVSGRLANETRLFTTDGSSAVVALAHDPVRRRIAAAVLHGKIIVWDYTQRKQVFQTDFGKLAKRSDSIWVEAVRLTADGSKLIAAGRGIVEVFDIATRKVVRRVDLDKADDHYIESIVADTALVLRTKHEGCGAELVLIDFAATPTRHVLDKPAGCRTTQGSENDHSGDISLVTDNTRGAFIFGRSGRPGLTVIDIASARATRTIPWQPIERETLTAIDASGDRVATVGVGAQRILRRDDGSLATTLRAHGGHGFAFASPDGKSLLLLKRSAERNDIVSWPVSGVSPVFNRVTLPTGYAVRNVAPAAGLVIGENKNDARFVVYSIATGKETAGISLPDLAEHWESTLSPDGSKVLINGMFDADADAGKTGKKIDKTVVVTILADVATGKVLTRLRERPVLPLPGQKTDPGDTDMVRSQAFSPDGKQFAVGFQLGAAEIYDTASLKLVRRLEQADDMTTALVFSADGRFLIGGSRDSGVFVWDARTGKLLRTLERTSVAGHVSTAGLAISPDGELIAAGPGQRATSSGDVGAERRIQVWDTATGKRRFVLAGHEANVHAIVFTPDKRWIVSGSYDGTIRYWERATGRLAATFASAFDGRWAIVTEKGFFAASAGSGDLLSVVRGLEATSIDQMWQSLYAPDLVRETIAGDPSGEVKAAAAKSELAAILDSGPAPSVAITSHPATAEATTDIVRISARVTDRGKGLGRIEWRVNAVTTAVLPSPTAAAPEHTISQDIALDPGENAIEVVAYDRHNLIASVSARTTLRLATAQATTKPKLHILAIGIDAYIDRGWTPPGATEPSLFSPLSLAVKDARSFAAAMEQAAGGLYAGKPSVTLALDGDATRDALEATITRLAAEIGPRDTFVLFAAAHGDSRGGRFYLIPQDYDGGPDPATLAQRAIGQDRLQDWLANRIKARRAIVLLDTCESGALIAGYKRSRLEDAGAEAAIGRLHEATGRPVLTAAATGEFAHEGIVGATGANHGIFTWALLDALRNGDRDANGTIELSEIVAHVQEQVPRLAAQLKSGGRASSVVAGPVFGKQSARFGSRGEDFALVNRLR